MWVKVTIPWASWLTCLGEQAQGFLGKQKSLCDSELTFTRIKNPYLKLL